MTQVRKHPGRFCRFCAMLAAVVLCAGWFLSVHAQVFRGYSQSGSLEMKSDSRDNRKIISTFYPDGKLEAVYEYKDGKLNGVARQYYTNGVLKSEVGYKNDRREGTSKFYYQSGMLKARLEFQSDVQTGVPVYYDENGKPLSAPGAGGAPSAPSSPSR